MKDLREKLTARLPEPLHVRDIGTDIINLGATGRDLLPEDVQLLRVLVAEEGYAEVGSWIATEGMSWLSDGIQTVSMRVVAR